MAVVWKTDGVIESSSEVYFPDGKSQYFNNYSAIYNYNLSSELANLKSLYGTDNYTIDSVEFIFNDHFLLKSYQATGNYFIQYSSSSTSSISTDNAITNFVAINYSSVSSNTSLAGTSFPISTEKFSSFISTAEAGSFSVRIVKQNIDGSSVSDRVYYGPTSSNPIGTMTCRIKYSYKVTVPDPTVTAPSNIRFHNYTPGDSQYYLTWDPAIGSNGEGDVEYLVILITTGQLIGPIWGTSTIIGPFDSPPAGTEYEFTVYSQYSDVQNTDCPSYFLTFQAASTPTLGAPTINSVTQTPANSLNYTITWSAATGGTGSYWYMPYCDGTAIVNTFSEATEYSGAVTSYGEHKFKVRVMDQNTYEDQYSNEYTHNFTQSTAIPGKPTNLKIEYTAGSLNYILSWDSASGANSYVVLYQKDGANFWNPCSVPSGTSFSGSVPEYGKYNFKVQATNDSGTATSDPISATFTQASATPSITIIPNLTYSALGGTSISLEWDDNVEVINATYDGIYYYVLGKKINTEPEEDRIGIVFVKDGDKYNYLITETEFIDSLEPSPGDQYIFGLQAVAYGGSIANLPNEQLLSEKIWADQVFTYGNITTLSDPIITEISKYIIPQYCLVTWNASSTSGDASEIVYYVKRRIKGTRDWYIDPYASNIKDTNGTGILTYVYQEVEEGTTYEFQVVAEYDGLEASSNIYEYTYWGESASVELSKPGKPNIIQQKNGTYNVDWEASTASGGEGNITYSIINKTTSTTLKSGILTNSYNLTITSYEIEYEYLIKASYSGEEKESETTTCIFYKPCFTSFPKPSLNAFSGDSVKISWNTPTLQYTDGTIACYLGYYINDNNSMSLDIALNGTAIQHTSPINLDDSWFSEKCSSGDTIKFAIIAVATNLTNTVEGSSLSKQSEISSIFTYTLSQQGGSSELNGNSVGYYINGTWQECTAYYYDSSQAKWIECIPFYYDNGWQEINTKIT